MISTAGVIIKRPDGKVLIVHPTGAPDSHWSFPKGEVGNGQTNSNVAVNELFEETGIRLHAAQLHFIGSQPYRTKRKIVILFEYLSTWQDLLLELKCTSFFEQNGETIPEVDQFKWVTPEQAIELVHEAQRKIILQNEELKNSKRGSHK